MGNRNIQSSWICVCRGVSEKLGGAMRFSKLHSHSPLTANVLLSISPDGVLHMLSSAMTLLRRCRVNAALTIQLFSQLFHSINMWLFNKLVADSNEARYLCSRQWGFRIRARLAMIENWAEKQVGRWLCRRGRTFEGLLGL